MVNDGRRTAVSGLLPDQSALHGLRVKIRDLGLCVTGVRRRTRQSSNRDKEGCAMVGQPAVETLRAFGFDARADGLGNVFAHVWKRNLDGTEASQWLRAPTDRVSLLRWLAEFAPP